MASAPIPPSKLAQPPDVEWAFDGLKWIGSGATGDVYRGRHRVTGREVAVKIAREENGSKILAFEAERLAGALFPGLPELLAVGRVPRGALDARRDGLPYLAMSWMAGRVLDPAVRRPDKERHSIALAVARDVGAAIAHLDAIGVAHGDVKPANMQLVGPERETEREIASSWRVNLIDLGLAGDAAAELPAGGTPRYMPPELWTGARGGDGRARDRFALGLVLAEIVVPELARSNDLAGDARQAKLPAPFDAWCAALLAPEPGARPRAAWISAQARAIAGFADSEDENVARCTAAVRAAHLRSPPAAPFQAAR